MSTLLRARASVAVALVALLAGCADTAVSPVAAPGADSGGPSSSPSAPSSAVGTVAPGERVVPIGCDETMPVFTADYDLRARESTVEFASEVMMRTAGALTCRFDAGAGEISVLLLISPRPSQDWEATLREGGGIETAEGIEQRYCFGELGDAKHCGFRWRIGSYAAELFLNSASTTGLTAVSIEAAAAEFREVLMSLEEPPRNPSMQLEGGTAPRPACDSIALGEAPIAREIPWLGEVSPTSTEADDAPSIYYQALRRTGSLGCAWSEPTVGQDIGFDKVEIMVVPGGGWGFELLAGPSRAPVAGADEASIELRPDGEGGGVRATARAGDDLVVVDMLDASVNGLLAEDRRALTLRLLESSIAVLSDAGTIGAR